MRSAPEIATGSGKHQSGVSEADKGAVNGQKVGGSSVAGDSRSRSFGSRFANLEDVEESGEADMEVEGGSDDKYEGEANEQGGTKANAGVWSGSSKAVKKIHLWTRLLCKSLTQV